jgi:NMD protein affecting ribosome stability and mRNA decay
MHPDYFEGILQLRNPTPELMDYVQRLPVSELSRTKMVENGFDCYFVSQRFLRSFGKELQKRFPGELRSTRRLHTRSRQTGKDVYRVTVLFRMYPVKKGDVVEIRGTQFLVLAVGKKLYLQNQKTREKQWLAYDKLPASMR